VLGVRLSGFISVQSIMEKFMAGRKIPYPWGRLSPEKRIHEIENMIERQIRQKEVLGMQFEESIKKLDMNISALGDQISVAKSFGEEDKWSTLRERVMLLELEGVDAMNAISGKLLSEAEVIIRDLEKSEKSEIVSYPSSLDEEEFLISSVDSIEQLFEGE
jgi:hypothetical protein